MKAHELDPWASRNGEPKWRDDGTCSYCGSITPAEAIRLMGTDGTKYSGSDWKYGYPHKFYISNAKANPAALKFYTTHLSDCTDEELAEFSKMSDQFFGITWGRDERGIFYKSVPNMQLWGVVGKNSCAICGCAEDATTECPCDCHRQLLLKAKADQLMLKRNDEEASSE